VALARPRARASAGFAALEEHVLQRVLKTAPNDDALSHRAFDVRDESRPTRPTDVRWAV
jgi:sulfonate transport system ATP-binding protein